MATLLCMSKRILSLALVVSAVAAACGSDANPSASSSSVDTDACVQSTGASVTIYSGRSEELIGPVVEDFECDTGIETRVRWGDNADLALFIKEEGDRTDADVFISSSPGPVGFLEGEGLLQPISNDVLDLVADQNRSTSGTWVGFSGRKRVLVYNTAAFDESDLPDSIFDLTDEQYRGKVAIPATNGSFLDWFTVFRDQHGTDVATQWINDMAANDARYYTNNRSIVEAAGRGEIELGLVNHYYNIQAVQAQGEAHEALNHDLGDDDIGSLLIITAATITAAADDNEAAESFLAYLLSESVQTYLTNETFEYPLTAGVAANESLPPLNALEVGTVDFDALGGGFEESLEIVTASGILNQ
jgi:iron(III) transport system substrate-binding protein